MTSSSILLGTSAAVGILVSSLYYLSEKKKKKKCHPTKCQHCKNINVDDPLRSAKIQRARLPSVIVLVRHGESECNADHTLWRTKPDNLVCLTPEGYEQAYEAGKRIESILSEFDNVATKCELCGGNNSDPTPNEIRRIHLVVSPFERTLQTAMAIRKSLEHLVVRSDVEPRIREQEFGNLQGDEFKAFREEQKFIGRFWYRFPTGESGADVYDRVKSWWHENILQVNQRVGYDPVQAMVVVTHGLTMRFVMMQLFNWSPTTFHSVWNADNCHIYVLRKDLSKPGVSPYIVDDRKGDTPKSSIGILVVLRSGEEKMFTLQDYLSIPPPRTSRHDLIKKRLALQYDELEEEDIVDVHIGDGTHKILTGTGAACGNCSETVPPNFDTIEKPCAPKEMSCRFPNFAWPEEHLIP